MENFTPVSAILGGTLIGLSATLLMALNGKIAGVSGILAGTLFDGLGERYWKIAFILGVVIAPLGAQLVLQNSTNIKLEASYPTIVLGGLLVGVGTSLGSGCTSGHGVCGLSRLSARSFVAVLAFMGAGILTASAISLYQGA